MTKRGDLDETDMKILHLLRTDARLSYREIGKQIRVSTGTVSERVRHMQEDGVIKGFVTAINPEKMGYHVTMLMELSVKHDVSLMDFEKTITDFDEAACVHHVTGDSDLVVLMRCRDQDHAAEMMDRVRTLEAVQSLKSQMVMRSTNPCGKCGCDCASSLSEDD